jgi:hypothetical protein
MMMTTDRDEPRVCGTCVKCQARTVLAMRTLNMASQCHCTSCGHVWREDAGEARPAGPVSIRLKPDRRRRLSIH